MNADGSKTWRDLWLVSNWASAVVLVAAALVVGGVLGWSLAPARLTTAPAGEPVIWTCSMHPEVRRTQPGMCPKCNMPLERLRKRPAAFDDSAAPERIALDPAAVALIDVRTAPVRRQFVTAEVRLDGEVDFDETRLAHITAWVPGRLDRLFVDYTGVAVRKGDHLVEIYSPDLLAAQEEFLQARKALDGLKPDETKLIRESVEAMHAAARDKLALLGLTDAQIDALARRGKASDRLTIFAPRGGIVVGKDVRQGAYVKTGTRIYTIADLSRVWVVLDAYESDLPWLRYGQKVEFTVAAAPGRTFGGTIAFIDPVLTDASRTVRVRVNVPNPDGALKPKMSVVAVVRSRIAAGGKVMAADLAGKWISPMHPEVVKDAPGKCDVCGMPLMRAETLGYVSADPAKAEPPLVVPASAVLRTGKRAIVFVRAPDAAQPTFEMRQVTLGARAGKRWLVQAGLVEGEQVVVQGGFKIDAERQIQGLPSLMDPAGSGATGHAHGGHGPSRRTAPAKAPATRGVPGAFTRQLAKVFDAYFAMGKALASDDLPGAVAAARTVRSALGAVKADLLDARQAAAFKTHAAMIVKRLDAAAAATKIEPARGDFALLSEQIAVLAASFGGPGRAVYRLQCPMAFSNRGATWLQGAPDVRNPYFGAAMLECGSVVETFKVPSRAPGTQPASQAHDHK